MPASSFERIRQHESVGGRVTLFNWPGAPELDHADDRGLYMMALFQLGQPQLAAQLIDAPAGAGSRRHPRYHHMRASLLETAGKLEEARKAYLRALILERGRPETGINLGLLLGRMGKPQEGLEYLDKVLASYPLADNALRNRALARRALGDLQGFEQDLVRAFELRPDATLARALAEHFRARADEDAAARYTRAAESLR